MKRIFALIAVITAFTVVATTTAYAKDDVSSKTYLTKVAKEVTKQLKLPVMVDEETRLDSVEGLDREFKYNYVLVNYTTADLDQKKFVDAMKPTLADKVCNNEKVKKEFIDNGVAVTFSYAGKDHKLIGSVTITDAQCK